MHFKKFIVELIFALLFSIVSTSTVKSQKAIFLHDTIDAYAGGGYLGNSNLVALGNMAMQNNHGVIGHYTFFHKDVVFNLYEAFLFGSISESHYEDELTEIFKGTSFGDKNISHIDNLDANYFSFGSKSGGDIGFRIFETKSSRLDALLGVSFGFNFPFITSLNSDVNVHFEDGSQESLEFESGFNFNLMGELYTGIRYVNFFSETVGFTASMMVGSYYSFWFHTPKIRENFSNTSYFSSPRSTGINLFTTASSQIMLSPQIGLVINLD
jgi:hypothetical protein